MLRIYVVLLLSFMSCQKEEPEGEEAAYELMVQAQEEESIDMTQIEGLDPQEVVLSEGDIVDPKIDIEP